MLAVIVYGFEKEIIFTFCLMFVAALALFLAKWTLKNMLIYIFCIATVLAFMKAANIVSEQFFKNSSSETIVPVWANKKDYTI